MKLIFNPRSFPLNPGVKGQILHQVGKIEVNLQARGCTRNWFPRQCSSSSLALARLSVMESSESRRDYPYRVFPSIPEIPLITPVPKTLPALVVGSVLTRASTIS